MSNTRSRRIPLLTRPPRRQPCAPAVSGATHPPVSVSLGTADPSPCYDCTPHCALIAAYPRPPNPRTLRMSRGFAVTGNWYRRGRCIASALTRPPFSVGNYGCDRGTGYSECVLFWHRCPYPLGLFDADWRGRPYKDDAVRGVLSLPAMPYGSGTAVPFEGLLTGRVSDASRDRSSPARLATSGAPERARDSPHLPRRQQSAPWVSPFAHLYLISRDKVQELSQDFFSSPRTI